MRDSVHSRGAELVVGYLPEPTRSTTDVCLSRALVRAARSAGALVALPALQDASGGPLPGTRLARDGHLTGEGAQRVADDLLAVLRRASAGAAQRPH